MTDIVSTEKRTEMMRGIRARNTRPEILVRQWLHRHGYRFRLHRRDLPGTPDIVLPRYRTAILVMGCFWHRHSGCRLAYTPKSNVERWEAKFAENQERDRRKLAALEALGWRVLIVWECEVRSGDYERKLAEAFPTPRD
jgi:DNA mismatch endonuclease (patch repair protein)